MTFLPAIFVSFFGAITSFFGSRALKLGAAVFFVGLILSICASLIASVRAYISFPPQMLWAITVIWPQDAVAQITLILTAKISEYAVNIMHYFYRSIAV